MRFPARYPEVFNRLKKNWIHQLINNQKDRRCEGGWRWESWQHGGGGGERGVDLSSALHKKLMICIVNYEC